MRRLTYMRLRWLPLTAAQAYYWAGIVKRYPSVFHGPPYVKWVRLRDVPAMGMRCGLIDVIERTLLTEGRWEPHVGRVVQAVLRPGDVFVDVGANIGYFSLMGACLVGQEGHVYALEPCRRTFARLLEHIRLNGLNNVTALPLAASNCNGTAVMHFLTANNTGASTLRPCPQTAQDEVVFTFPLDSLLAGIGTVPRLVKIDVEGLEMDVLRGMRVTLTKHRPFVVAEVVESFLRERMGAGSRQLIDGMVELGYEAFVLCPGQPDRCQPFRSGGAALSGQADVLFVPLGRECPLVVAPD